MLASEPQGPAAGGFQPSQFRYYDLFVSAFIVILLVSNLVGQKLVQFGPFRWGAWEFPALIASGANLLFPLTYIFGDVFTEVYGYAGSRRAIWLGFFASGLMSVVGWLVVQLPPAPTWHNQQAFQTVFDFIPRLVVASLIAFVVGEFVNSFTLARMKLLTGGRHLWSRVVGSTVTGQLVDTVVLYVIGFGGTQPWDVLLRGILSAYTFKVIYEIAMTPLTYRVVFFLKRIERADVFDRYTDFNPFRVFALK